VATVVPGLQEALASLDAEPDVLAACLVGSYARQSSVPDAVSDVDIVAIVDDKASPNLGRHLLKQVRSQGREPHVELRTLKRSVLARLLVERTVYAAHLARDGRVLFDRGSGFAEFQERFPLDKPVSETAHHLRTRFALYESLGWCNGEYLFCFADLYAIGRSSAMLGLAQLGIFEFDRTRVFSDFAQHYEGAASAAWTLHALEPFYMYVRRNAGDVVHLPFVPHDCHAEAEAARQASEAVLKAIK
jgi:hypothetical protein